MSMNFVSFNQDYSHLGVGTTKGFRLYSTDPFAKIFEDHEGDISIMEMLFSTSLVALILSPRLLRIQNAKSRSTICELTFPTRVLAVRLNRKRLVVVLEQEIYLYDISNMRMLHTLETSPNPHAICTLSSFSQHNYLAYPLPQKAATPSYALPSHAPPSSNHVVPTSGVVMIFDATKMQAVNVVEAHQTPLSCIALNNEGTLLATASEKGTIIRVFSVPDANKLFQFRRGSIPARIYCMSYNAASTLLCVSSATETVHIFRLSAQDQSRNGPHSSPPSSPGGLPHSSHDRSTSPGGEGLEESGPLDESEFNASGEHKAWSPTIASVIKRTSQQVSKSFATRIGGYLPTAVAEIWEPARDFAWVKIPRCSNPASSAPVKAVVAMSSSGPQLMVVSSEGKFFVFNVDLEKGGEGTLLKQFSVLEVNENLTPIASAE